MSSSNGSLSKKLEQVTKQLQETSNKIEVLEANVEEQSKIITAKDTEIRGDPTEPASCRAIDADEGRRTVGRFRALADKNQGARNGSKCEVGGSRSRFRRPWTMS